LQQTRLEALLDEPANAAKLSLYESGDGRFRGTSEDVNAYEFKQRQASGKFSVYESDDGLFRGKLEDVNAYEERLRQANGTCSVYESSDGRFRGGLEDLNKYKSGRVRLDAAAAVMWNNSVVLPYGFTSGLLGIYWDWTVDPDVVPM